MAGHSKWANIRFKKSAKDAKKGKVFTKIIREITVAARMQGDDPSTNPRLRDAMSKAYKANMKKDTIESAVAKGAGKLEGVNYIDNMYEGYGPFGVAILVSTLSDNKNRTVSEVRHGFGKFGGNLGADGSVKFLFDYVGEIIVKASEEDIFEIATSNNAIDISPYENYCKITCSPKDYEPMLCVLKDYEIIENNLTYAANQEVKISDDKEQEQLNNLFDHLLDLDDVQEIFHNAILN